MNDQKSETSAIWHNGQKGYSCMQCYVLTHTPQWLNSKTITLEEAATETGSCSAPLTPCELPLGSQKTLYRVRLYKGHTVSSYKTPLQQLYDGE